MGGVVGSEFAAVLERNRDSFNARFAHARRTNRGLDPAAFSQYLRLCVEPTVAAYAAAGQEAADVDRLAGAMYDIALELVAQELVGPGGRFPVLSRMWVELLPAAVRHFGGRPRDAIAALSNAVANLSAEPGFSAQAWLDRMLDLEPQVSGLSELLGLGQLLAWRLGMAHYREGALGLLDTLPEPLTREAVGAVDVHERWPQSDDSVIRPVAEVGDFAGLGGPFESPPEVMQSDGRLFAYDNKTCFTLHADRFGATLKRFGRNFPDGKVLPARYMVNDGEVQCVDHPSSFVPGYDVRSWACSDAMAVVTSPHSHRISIIALSAS